MDSVCGVPWSMYPSPRSSRNQLTRHDAVGDTQGRDEQGVAEDYLVARGTISYSPPVRKRTTELPPAPVGEPHPAMPPKWNQREAALPR